MGVVLLFFVEIVWSAGVCVDGWSSDASPHKSPWGCRKASNGPCSS